MAAIVNGRTLISAITNSGWTSEAVAEGTLGIPFVNLVGDKLDGSLFPFGQRVSNDATSLVSGNVYTAWFDLGASYDVSGAMQAILIHIADVAGGSSAMQDSPSALRLALHSGGDPTTGDWASWHMEGETLWQDGDFHPAIAGHRAPDVTGPGSFDDTDVTHISVGFEANVNGFGFGLQLALSQLLHIDELEFTSNDAATYDFDDYLAILDRFGGDPAHAILARNLGTTYEFGAAISLTKNFNTPAAATGIQFRVDNAGYGTAADAFYRLQLASTQSAQTFSNLTVSVAGITYDLDISGPATITNGLVAEARNITVSNASAAITNANIVNAASVNLSAGTHDITLTNPTDVDISNASLNISIINPTNAIQWTADLAANSSITTDGDIDVTFDVGDYQDITLDFTASNNFTVSPATDAGIYNFAGMTSSGTVNFDIPVPNSFDSTIQVPSALSFSPPSPISTSGGGTLIIDFPPVTVDWVAANLLEFSRVRLYNITAATEIENVVVGASGYSRTLTLGVDYTSGDEVVMLVTYQQGGDAREVLREARVLTTADITINTTQRDWVNPNVLGIDGSTVTECMTDFVEVQVEVNDPSDSTTKARVAAFIVDAITTADGIRNWVSLDGIPAIDYPTSTSAIIDVSVASVEVINVKAASKLDVSDSFEFSWSDGTDRVDAILGSTVIWIAPARVLLQNVGSGPLTPAQEAELTAASQAATVNTKIGTPVVTVSDDIAAVDTAIAVVDANVDTVLTNTVSIESKIDVIDSNIDTSLTLLTTIDTNLDTANANILVVDGKVDGLPTAEANADSLLGRNIAGSLDGGRTVSSALFAMRNRVEVDAVGGTITVYNTDDLTAAWTGGVTFAARDAIAEIDPT